MRVSHTLMVQIGQDTAFKKKLFYIEQAGAQVVSDGFLRQANSSFNIAAQASEAMNLGDVTDVRGIYIECSVEAKVYLNGSAVPLQLRKAPNATLAKLFVECDVTSLTIENPDQSVEAEGVYVIWGDVLSS